MATTLYEKMGGEPAIKEIVDDFYRDVLADEIVSHFLVESMEGIILRTSQLDPDVLVSPHPA
ncbi:hypothetical protein QUA43_29675, partial [Microcoleus sp. N9_B4]|uniref:globin domain-containing protein n=1 Tax=Microcoleus sp. N9_B4 TaxID=3055386 RepID=UPI003B045957